MKAFFKQHRTIRTAVLSVLTLVIMLGCWAGFNAWYTATRDAYYDNACSAAQAGNATPQQQRDLLSRQYMEIARAQALNEGEELIPGRESTQWLYECIELGREP